MDVLVIDVGGSFVKIFHSGTSEVHRFESGKQLTPASMVSQVHALTAHLHYQVVSIGYPGSVGSYGPRQEPWNLAPGWVGYNFEKAFDRPVIVVNDAVLQALGGYDSGKMLFLGLGTGLGSALVVNSIVVPLEFGGLPFSKEEMLWERLGHAGLKRHGKDDWQQVVVDTTRHLLNAVNADYVVLGGGNAELVDPLPENVRRGGNEDAFVGGIRLWEDGVQHRLNPTTRMWSVL